MPKTLPSLLAPAFVLAGLLAGSHGAAQASPILVVTNGVLMGAQGIEVRGRTYDVSFSDERAAGALPFVTALDAKYASEALDDVIFQGAWDNQPGRTNGCASPLSCSVVTAYHVGWLGVDGWAFVNTFGTVADMVAYSLVLGNSANSSLMTYANWSVHQERLAVPEPASLLLAGAGLAGLALARRRRRG